MTSTRDQNFRRGIALFNRGEFFHAHEALEDAWRETRGAQRLFMQGIVQVAVALHHYRGGNLVGARGVLGRALRNLESYPASCGGIDLARLKKELAPVLKRAQGGEPPATHWPKIRRAR
jgi:predicted metal-dependent hydrolase